jgi:competence protein ComEC
VAPLGPDERALVPALVVGDDRGMPQRLVDDFRVAGLTHLSAVSGTNLTLVVGFLLVLARWVGVRARGLLVVGALGVAGFVLLARTVPIVLLSLLCIGVVAVAPSLLRRRAWSACCALVLVFVLLRPLPSVGWPPPGWVLVACDVGQGDGLVLNAGRGQAVVVDTGPDPTVMDRCLDRLGVARVPVLVLTHFHADHVDGLSGVLDGHRVDEVEVTATRVPEWGAEEVEDEAAAAHVPLRVPGYGESRRVGEVTWQVIGPAGVPADGSHGEEGSVANNASLVLLVQVRGVRILMAGDMEPEAQRALAAHAPSLHVDVLKVPHHGSRYQDPAFLAGLGARLAVVSVGADNDYGHPAPSTLTLLRRAGMVVRRTDRDGDVAVVVTDGRLGVVSTD